MITYTFITGNKNKIRSLLSNHFINKTNTNCQNAYMLTKVPTCTRVSVLYSSRFSFLLFPRGKHLTIHMPQTNPSLQIAIIGAGFSGMMTAVQLMRKATSPLTLYLINDKYEFGKGPAYSTTHPKHILNVPAAKMTAYPDQPNHFLDWAHRQDAYKDMDKEVLGKVFLPRRDFGRYLSEVWAEALAGKRDDTAVHIIIDKAVDVVRDGSRNLVQLEGTRTIAADYVVLATGNEPPRNLPVSDPALYDDPNYIGDPWNNKAAENLDRDRDILIIGNGLTMVDIVIGIMDTDFRGVIHTLSPDGLAILPHRYGYIAYGRLAEEVKAPYKLNELYSLINKHIKTFKKSGLSPEPVIDSLRPLTQKIWQGLSLEDKQRFMKYLMPHWNKIRHRMPGHMYDYLMQRQIAGRMVIHRGRLLNMTQTAHGLSAEILETNSDSPVKLDVSRIINCIGPNTYVSQSLNPLLQKLVSKGMLQADPLRIGMQVTDHWTLVGADGQEIPSLYTIGGNLRGLLWETTAVPELRGQAEKLAGEILSKAAKV